MLVCLSKHFSAPSSSLNTSKHPQGFRQRDPAANFTTVGKPPPPESTISLRFSSPSLPEQSFCRLPFQHGLCKHGNREAGTTEKREVALTFT